MRRYIGWRLNEDEGEERFQNLEYKGVSVIKLFMPRKLKSFSWEMGTCVPEEIMAEKGILGRMHPTIQSLRLITDPECPRGACEPMRLPNFRQLKSLSWKGPNAACLLELGRLIIKNSQSLQEVEIDLLDWERVEGINGYYDDSDSDGWGTDSDDYWIDCFLEYAPKLNVPLKLKELEIEDHGDWPDPPRLGTVWGFLDSFSGLEKLYLSFEELIGILPPCGHISRHRDTLKRLEQYDGVIDNTLIWNSEDSDEESDGDGDVQTSTQNLPSDLHLECLGLGCDPESAPKVFDKLGPVSSLKVLHMRPETADEQRFTRSADEDGWSHLDDKVVDRYNDPEADILTETVAEDSAEDTPQVSTQPVRPIQLLEPFTSLAKWAFGPEDHLHSIDKKNNLILGLRILLRRFDATNVKQILINHEAELKSLKVNQAAAKAALAALPKKVAEIRESRTEVEEEVNELRAQERACRKELQQCAAEEKALQVWEKVHSLRLCGLAKMKENDLQVILLNLDAALHEQGGNPHDNNAGVRFL
ncbi:hypothetical protein CEP51_003216 [Fusarium floridanum]|uniref:Uncharacterized protein n=1 Tax=Fusarium floridanum TaxID=1325733 RepID=A0A428S7H4_9HYPO|nr:hypothetical protein CEP51_003216 [Fusarium floridanum]